MDPIGGPPVNSESVKAQAQELGFGLVGVCRATPPLSASFYRLWIAKGRHGSMDYLARSIELRSDLERLLPGCRSVIAVGLNYNQSNLRQVGQPRIARYALGRDYHKVVRAKLRRLERWIEASAPGHAGRVCVDSAPVLEREYAHRAGLGWFGKNTMLIDSRRGSWFVIGLLLTTLSLDPDEPAEGGCGTCRLCVDACPSGCIVYEDGRWQIDARTCVSYLTIEHKGSIDPGLESAVGEWTFGCDVCQEVCPFNQPRPHQPERARPTSEPDFLAKRDWPSLERLAVIGPEEWDDLTQGSPVRRAGLEGLRRNAQINMRHAIPTSPRRAAT
jgi:epoxyqueuosine reductase